MKIHIDTDAQMDKAKASNVKQGKKPDGSPLPKKPSTNRKKPASPVQSSQGMQAQSGNLQGQQKPSKPLPKRPPKEKTPPQDVAQARKRQSGILKEKQGRELKNPGEPTVRAIDAGAGNWPNLYGVL